jgi:hypothetical protein
MFVFMNTQFGESLSMGSGLLFATGQNSPIGLSIAGRMILVAIAFFLIVAKIYTKSDQQHRF